MIVERVVLLAATAVALWTFSGWLSRRKRVLAQAEVKQDLRNTEDFMEE